VKACEFCDKQFKPKVTYQIYCSKDCRDSATKNKIAVRYEVTKRQKRKGKIRLCLGGCGVKLSIYNDSGFCSNCNVSKKAVDKMLKQVKGYFEYEQDN
jgi:uncharacterized protein YmfQ (DUF2313 family)